MLIDSKLVIVVLIVQKILIENFPTSELHLDHQLEKLQKSNHGFSLEFQNGIKIESQIFVGADGIHSEAL